MSFEIETGNVEIDVLLPYKLSYKVYLPKNYNDTSTAFPLVLFLHGVGERGDDIDLVETHGLPKVMKNGKTFPFITVAPQCPNQEWWSRAAMVKCLVYLVKKITKMYRCR
jgi:Predicted peptidase